MKRIVTILSLAIVCTAANAQYYYQDNKNVDMLRHAAEESLCRTEIVLPKVNGYTVYKADLHTHTVFSDGSVLPKWRVNEAWIDGLDVMAVTEHVEHRPSEKWMVDYLEKYRDKKYDKALNATIQRQDATEEGIMVDLNYAVEQSRSFAKAYGITIIPGAEITRDGKTVGHFNALFTKDNNKIYDKDPVQSVRNAKAQGALVMHNHPGWRRKNLDPTPVENMVYGEGLVDGIEVMNGGEFYPGIIDRVREKNLFIAANSDIHIATANFYKANGVHRPMTLILAKDKSLKSLREALESRRTIAYAYNTLCGSEQLLKDFFEAGVTLEKIGKDSKGNRIVMLTNNTSISYVIQRPGGNHIDLPAFSTVTMKIGKKESSLEFAVINMFCSKDVHPVMSFPVR